MPRPKYKNYFTIEITKESIETVPGGTIQKKTGEFDDDNIAEFEYIQEPDKKEVVTRIIYTQTVEKMDLKKVITAINAD